MWATGAATNFPQHSGTHISPFVYIQAGSASLVLAQLGQQIWVAPETRQKLLQLRTKDLFPLSCRKMVWALPYRSQTRIAMNALLRLLSLTGLLTVTQLLTAQSLIFHQKTRTDAFLVKLHGGGPSEAVTDHFIERLSSPAKPAARTEFVVAQDEYIRLTKVSPTEYDVYITLGNMRLTGDTQYRGFSMLEQLKPTAVQFTVHRVNQAGIVVESFPFGEVALLGDPVVVANFRAMDSTRQFTDCTVKVADKQVLYSREAKGAFDQRAIRIDDYYAALPKLTELEQDLRRIQPDDFEHVESQQNDLNQMIQRLNAITSEDYPQTLDLSASDPAGFLPKYQAVAATAQDLNARISRTRNEIPERYYQRGQQHVQQGRPAEGNKDLLEAVRLKPTLAPAHLELARLRYREGDVPAAKACLTTIFKECQPDDQTRTAATQLGKNIYQNHLSVADYAIKQKNYPAGLQSLTDARAFCTDLGLGCTAQLDDLTTLAHTGVFRIRVDTARLLLSTSQFEAAEAKATEALAYQQAYAAYIQDASLALRVQADAQTRIYQRTVASANGLASQGKLKDAEAEARKALAYQATHTAAIAEPSAAQNALLNIKDLQYKGLISRARSLGQQQQHRQALPLLEEAVLIEAEFAVTKDPGLWVLVQATAKPIVLDDLTKGQQHAQANKLGDARATAQAAHGMAEKYRLATDPDILAAEATLSSKIASQECTNAQNDLEALLKQAADLRQQKKFIEASATYDQGLAVVARQPHCGIDTRRAADGKTEIAVAVQYQNLLAQSRTAYERNDNPRAIATYDQAGDLAARENIVARYGIQHATLFDYIMGSGRIEFTRYGAQHFTEKKAYDQAVELLHKAVQMGVAKGLTKDLMTRLGTELGLRDKQEAPGTDPKSEVLKYTRGNSKLKTLASAYLKARK